MFKFFCCIVLCVSFPLVLNADDDFRKALNRGDVDVVKALLAERPSLLEEPITINASVKKRPILYVVQKHAMLRLLLEAGADPDFDEARPLQSAILYHDLESVRILLDAGAKIKKAKENSSDRSTLEIAAGEGQLPIIELLVDRGASVDDGQALGIAIGYRHWKVARFLLNRGADPNHGYAFTMAAERAPLDIVKLMLDLGADANKQNNYGSALANATGDFEKVKLLVASGAEVNGSWRDGKRALHAAAARGNIDVVAFLLEHGAVVNENIDQDDQTPLDLAIRNGHEYVVQQLLDAGAKRTLHADVALGDIERVKEALEKGADVNLAIAGDYAPRLIHTAIKFEQLEMLKLLINNGANVDATIGDVSTVHQAVSQRSVPLVKALLSAGANVNAILFDTGYGRGDLTPLHLLVDEAGNFGAQSELKPAASSDEKELIIGKLLLENGADLTLESELNETPLQLAKRLGKTHLVQLFEQSLQ